MIMKCPTWVTLSTRQLRHWGLWEKIQTIKSQTWNKTAWLSTIPLPVLHFIITIKLEPYRLLLCPAVELIFYSLATTPEPLLFIRHMNSPEGYFGAHASLCGTLGTAAHETVIKTHLLEEWHWASPLELQHVPCMCVLYVRMCVYTWWFGRQYPFLQLWWWFSCSSKIRNMQFQLFLKH